MIIFCLSGLDNRDVLNLLTFVAALQLPLQLEIKYFAFSSEIN